MLPAPHPGGLRWLVERGAVFLEPGGVFQAVPGPVFGPGAAVPLDNMGRITGDLSADG